MNALAQQDFYLNSSQYTDLKQGVRDKAEGANTAALQQFESLFIAQMLKEMRAAAVVDESQHSSYMDFYTDMYDKQLATIMAKQGGIGIAKQLQSQLVEVTNAQHKKDYTGGKFFPLTPDVVPNNGMPLKTSKPAMTLESNDQSRELKLPYNLSTITGSSVNSSSLTETVSKPSVEQSNILSFALGNKIADDTKIVQKQYLQEEFHQLQTQVDNSVVQLTALDKVKKETTALVDEKIHHHSGWAKPEHFVKELMPHAQVISKQLGVKPEVLIAQSALETGWGKHTMRREDGSVAFSLFGIKADHRWSGDTVQVPTLEFKNGQFQKEIAHFRAYDSVGEAVQDYANFIQGSSRYQDALNHNQDDAHYVKGLQKAGYATDPNYANKILNIVQGETLKQGLASIQTTSEVA